MSPNPVTIPPEIATVGPKVPEAPVPRILFIDHTAKMGGGEFALLNLAIALDRSRYLPVVMLLQDGPLRQKLEAARIETHLLSADANLLAAKKDSLGLKSLLRMGQVLTTLSVVWKLSRRIAELNVAVIHTNSLKSDIIGGLAGRLAGKAVVWHVRDRIASDYLPVSVVWMFRLLANIIPTWVIANSAATLQTLARAGRRKGAVPSGIQLRDPLDLETDSRPVNEPRVPTRIVHDGTSAPAPATLQGDATLDASLDPALDGARDAVPDSASVGVLDETLNAPAPSPLPANQASPVIGLVGRIAKWKGQHIFLYAAAWVLRRYPHARFQIVGAPLFDEREYEQTIYRLATDLGISHAVEFTGFRSDVTEIIAGFDILVHASITGEPFGQVIIEGMAAGKPVVATDGGGVPEIVVHDYTGLLVPMDNAAAMAAAICTLLANPDMARQMGERGRQRVNDRFTIAHTAAKVQEVYDTLLKRTARQ